MAKVVWSVVDSCEWRNIKGQQVVATFERGEEEQKDGMAIHHKVALYTAGTETNATHDSRESCLAFFGEMKRVGSKQPTYTA